MIEDIDAHHHACTHHAAGQDQIVVARAWGRRTDGCGTGRSRPRTAAAASRNTSRGCTTVESREPIDTSLMRMRRFLLSSITIPNCSTAPRPVLRQQVGGQLRAASVRRGRSACRARASGGPARRPQAPGRRVRGRCRRPGAGRADGHARESMQAADVLDQIVGQIESVAAARSAPKYERQQLVVAESGRSETLQLLTRAIVRCDSFHLYSNPYASLHGARSWRVARRRRFSICVCVLLHTRKWIRPRVRSMPRAPPAPNATPPTEFAAATQALKQRQRRRRPVATIASR